MGCNRYTDIRGKTYIYTGVEPYFTNEVFPVFDQPDLKADLILLTVTPSQWVSNST
jgi:aminopeptidase N